MDLRVPINRNTSLPVSAQECAASASIEADPVTTAATVLATAINRFAPSATTTIRKLSSPAVAVFSEGLFTASSPEMLIFRTLIADSGGTGIGRRLSRCHRAVRG